ncbi:MAG: hypothetical protein RLZZ293_78 [Pseudomonadota bacterium]|jgi:dolichol-phosphate mannosyltransferase
MSYHDLTNLTGKKIFLTGGTGFIGKNLLCYLIKHKIMPQQLTILSRNPDYFKQNYPQLLANWIDFAVGDIVNLTWNQQNYDYVIHAATSIVAPPDSVQLFDEIILGTKNILQFAEQAKAKCLLNFSSGAVYQPNQQLSGLTEISPLNQNLEDDKHTYSLAKASSEHLAYLYSSNTNLKVISLRCFCFGGDYLDHKHFALGEFIQKALNNQDITVSASKGVYRSYLSVDDLSKQIFSLLVKSESNSSQYEVFNLGSDQAISLPDLAKQVVATLKSKSKVYTPNIDLPIVNYYVPNVDKITNYLGIKKNISLDEIILATAEFYQQQQATHLLPTPEEVNISSKHSLSAIIACYNDAQAIPIMAERLIAVFNKCNLDYEIIFVSNGSTDNSVEVIRNLSMINPRIIGVTHSRSFEQTSQASFLNGMALATKQACVLLDGDLQDPPELIEDFVREWQNGYEIVYGIRHKREAPLFVQLGSKIFYRLFDKLSSVPMPHDAGDFSLIDRRVVEWLLATQEHDVLIRGMRSYLGFKHTGIKYFRPERMFGKSSNNFFKLIMWLKKGIFSYSRKPLDWITTAGFIMVSITIILAIIQILIRIFEPNATPHGLTTVILLIMFFGSFSILSISILGEYIAKIVEETKNRPIYIRDLIIKNGQLIKIYHDSKKNNE